MKLEYEIVKLNDGNYAVCEIRHMDHSMNTRHIYVNEKRKNCVEKLKEIKKRDKK